jgi:hypothetical protein
MVSYVVKKSLLILEKSKWSQVEDRTIEQLQFIEPNPKSETLRNNIVSYIKASSPAMFLSRYIKPTSFSTR